VSVRRNHLVLDGEQVDREMVDPIIYVDRTSDEEMEYAVRIGEEYVGGQLYKVAMMDRAGGKSFYSMEVPDGHFFLMGDNRNLARDSREFDVVPIESCVGQATFLLWPAEDSGDLKRDVRAFEWIH